MPPTSESADHAAELLADLGKEADRLDHIDNYLKGDHEGPYTPRGASKEYKLLAERAITNVLPLIINTLAQSLYVDGYRRSADDEPAAGWQHWQHNGLDARQSAIHRAALAYGRAYVSVLPPETDDGQDQPAEAASVIRGWSPRQAIASY
ncbi:MAG: phage portal protein, partial [Stackebrandtia sp.]